jgi:hypothetical protein
MEVVDPGVVEITLFYMFVCVGMACKSQLVATLSQPVELRGSHYAVVDGVCSDQRDSLAYGIAKSLARVSGVHANEYKWLCVSTICEKVPFNLPLEAANTLPIGQIP